MTVELLVYIVLGVAAYTSAIVFYSNILIKKRNTNIYILLLGILRICLSSYVYFKFRNPFVNFLISTLFMILPLFLFKSHSKAIVASIFLMSFLYIIDSTVLYGISSVAEVLPNNLKYHSTLNILGLLLSQITSIFFLLYISKYFRRIFRIDYPLAYNLYFSILPVISVIILLSTRKISEKSIAVDTMLSAFIVLAMLLVLNTFFISLLSRNTNYFILRLQTNQMNEQIKSLVAQQDLSLESQRKEQQLLHDVKNILIAIKASVTNETDVITMIDSYLDIVSVDSIKQYSAIPALDAIIHRKEILAKANKKLISVNCSMQTIVSVNYTELGVVLGMILDNAIEATEKVPYESPIEVRITTRSNAVIISVSNSYEGVIQYDGSTIVSSKEENRLGYGINGIKYLVDKNDGSYDISHDNGIFSVQVVLYEYGLPPFTSPK